MKHAHILLITAILFAAMARGATIPAGTPTLAHFSSAYAISSDGDTIQFDAGSSSWATLPATITKAITIKGAGPGLTTITDAAGGADNNDRIFKFQVSGKLVGIESLTISGGADAIGALVEFQAETNLIRLTNVNFINVRKEAIRLAGFNLGAANHCNFVGRTGVSAAPTGFYILGEGENGDESWDTRVPSWGDTNKFTIEHCGFNWESNANGAVDAVRGARWCFRYNSVTNVNVGNHGSDSSDRWRSDHSWEIYGNDFYNTTGSKMQAFAFRGGTGVLFDNFLHGDSNDFYDYIFLSNYRTTYNHVYTDRTCCDPWGAVTGLNPVDGNVDSTGWPPLDSIGRSSPTTYHTNSLAPNGLAPGYIVQASVPAYGWNNTRNGTVPVVIATGHVFDNTGSSPLVSTGADVIQEDRDFFNATKSGYVALADPHPFFGESTGSGGSSGPIIKGSPTIRGAVRFQVQQ